MTSQPDNTCTKCYYYDPYFIRCTRNKPYFYEPKPQEEPSCFIDQSSK